MASPVYSSITVGELFNLVSRRIRDQVASGTQSTSSANLTATLAGGGLERFTTAPDPRVPHKPTPPWTGTAARAPVPPHPPRPPGAGCPQDRSGPPRAGVARNPDKHARSAFMASLWK